MVLQLGVVGYEGPGCRSRTWWRHLRPGRAVEDHALRDVERPGSVGDSVFLIVPTQDVGTVSVRLEGDTVQPVPGSGFSATL